MNKKKLMSYLIVLMITLSILVSTTLSTNSEVDVIQIIENHYLNEDGIVKNYGRADDIELLSESIGLYMEYLLLRNDKKRFHQQYKLLKEHFIVKSENQEFVKWLVSDEEITTNALVDDLRIIKALIKGSQQFKNPVYKETALKISDSIFKTQLKDGRLVDFYDWKYKINTSTIHNSYLDIEGIRMAKLPLKYTKTLSNIPIDQDQVFYPEIYSLTDGEYLESDSQRVNLIDQLLIAININHLNHTTDPFYTWIKNEWVKNKIIYGQYERLGSQKPVVNYEANSVYGLSILYFLKKGDLNVAKGIHKKLREINLLSQDNFREVHFFDLIHFAIADYSFKNQKKLGYSKKK